MKKIAVIVSHGLNSPYATSGVMTFLRTIIPDWRNRFDCNIVELPSFGCLEPSISQKVATSQQIPPRNFRCESLRLGLGYIRDLLRAVVFFINNYKDIRRRIIVVNEFGCETIPIAVRLVFPLSRIIAIAHTHPGVLECARRPVRRWVEQFCCFSVSEVVFNSRSLQQSWREKVRWLPSKQSVIPHGLPPPLNIIPAEYPIKPANCVDFVYVARFVYEKGHRQLLDAWKTARDMAPDLVMRLVLVGDGPTLEDIRARSAALGIIDSVLFLGRKPSGADFFWGGDVGVLSTITPEAFGLVLLEAMSRRLPVLASNYGGIPEVVKNGYTGVLVDPKDSQAAASAIVKLASDATLREEMGKAGWQRWETVFNIENMLKAWGCLIEKGTICEGTCA